MRAIQIVSVLLLGFIVGCQESPVARIDLPPLPPAGYFAIGGTVSGLTGSGLVLVNAIDNVRVDVPAGANSFQMLMPSAGHLSALYDIRVARHPAAPAQACSIRNGWGTVGTGSIPSVQVTCTSDIARLGGTITGLVGSGLELMQSDAAVVQPLPGTTEFIFPGGLSPGMRYTVGVSRQPTAPSQTCTIRQGKGLIPDTQDVMSTVVECMDNSTSVLSGTYAFEPTPGTQGYFTFFDDGTYSVVVRLDDPACGLNDGNGVEYGVYNWNAATGEFAIRSAVVDTNGACGVADASAQLPVLLAGTLTKSGNLLTIASGVETIDLQPVATASGSMAGSWLPGTGDGFAQSYLDPRFVKRFSGAFIVFAADDSYSYVAVETQDAPSDGGLAGAEWGCADYGPLSMETLCYPGDPAYLDLNGSGGLSAKFSHGAMNALLISTADAGEFFFTWDVTRRQYGHLDSFWHKYVPD